MTSLAAAISVDARGPCALHIITDSRITWSDGSHWDAGQKTFASQQTPDIFGFCGDAFFPPAMLRLLLDQMNSGLLFGPTLNSVERHRILTEALLAGMQQRAKAPVKSFSLFHGARDGELMKSRFRLWETRFSADTNEWTDEERMIESECSRLVHIDGTGKRVIEEKGRDWLGTSATGTSRAAIWSFCDALASRKDPYSGGPPQLVGVWRKGVGKISGFIWNKKRYFGGLEVVNDTNLEQVRWVNNLFENCDGRTLSRLSNAQKQKKPPRAPR